MLDQRQPRQLGGGQRDGGSNDAADGGHGSATLGAHREGRPPRAAFPIYGFNIAGLVAPNAGAASASRRRAAPSPRVPTRMSDAKGANEMFRVLADMTGGRAIVDDNDPARIVPAVFDEMSAHYMIAYRATYPVADGKPRKLQIRVDRPGVTVLPSERIVSAERPKKKTETAPPPLLKAVADLLPKSEMPLAVTAAPFVLSMGASGKGPATGLLTTRPRESRRAARCEERRNRGPGEGVHSRGQAGRHGTPDRDADAAADRAGRAAGYPDADPAEAGPLQPSHLRAQHGPRQDRQRLHRRDDSGFRRRTRSRCRAS